MQHNLTKYRENQFCSLRNQCAYEICELTWESMQKPQSNSTFSHHQSRIRIIYKAIKEQARDNV